MGARKIKTKRAMIVIPILVILAAFATVSAATFQGSDAADISAHFLAGSRENKEQLRALFAFLDAPENSPETNFAIAREIAHNYFRNGEYGRLIHFLGGRTVMFPDDPFNSYYLLMIAYAHMRRGSTPIAARYFNLIVKNHPDLEVNGTSIHLTCLLQLIEMNDNPELQMWYYHELLSRFPDDIDRGIIWFRLAQIYESLGLWNDSIRAYATFLTQANRVVPGFPNAEAHARRIVAFSNSPRNWTFATLPELTAAVRGALETNNGARLRGMQAGVNFFTRSWGQGDIQSSQPFNIQNFLWGVRIRVADRFHERSNESEVFLRTWGWQQAVPVWYFHFRQIHFPADPAVHGRWEWAGIYYGESL